jgi:hypothetical protein
MIGIKNPAKAVEGARGASQQVSRLTQKIKAFSLAMAFHSFPSLAEKNSARRRLVAIFKLLFFF